MVKKLFILLSILCALYSSGDSQTVGHRRHAIKRTTVSSGVTVGSSMKVMSYYCAWNNSSGGTSIGVTGGCQQEDYFPIDSANIAGMFAIIYFTDGNILTSAPWYDEISGGFDSSRYFNGQTGSFGLDSLIAKSHRQNVKVLAELQAVSGDNFITVYVDSANTHALARAVAKYAKRHNFDGVDFNHELNEPDANTYARFFRLLRQELNTEFSPIRPLLTVASPQGSLGRYTASADTCIDYYNIEFSEWHDCYVGPACFGNAGGNGVWFSAAYDVGTLPCSADNTNAKFYNLVGSNSNVTQWLVKGSKLVPEIWGGNITFNDAGSLLRQYSAKKETPRRYTRLYQVGNGTMTQFYDSERKQHYLRGVIGTDTPSGCGDGLSAGDSAFVAMVTDSTVYNWVHWGDSVGAGGFWSFSLGYDFDEGYSFSDDRRTAIHRAMVNAISDIGTPTPRITVSATTLNFSTLGTGNSAEQTYTISGINLSTDIVITSTNPTNFEISTTSGSGFGSSVSLTPSTGIVNSTTIYVRFTSSTQNSYSGTITHTSTGAVQRDIALTGISANAAYVQGNTNSDDTGTNITTLTTSLTSVGSGHLVVAYVKHEGTATTITLSDGTNSFTGGTIASHGNGDLNSRFLYLLSSSSGSKTYTVTLGAARPYVRLLVAEFNYTGTALFDAQNTATGTSTAPNSGNITIAGATEVVLGGWGDYAAQTTSAEKINNVTADGTLRVFNHSSIWWRILSSTFSNGAASATISPSNDWTCNILSIKIN